MGNTQGFSTRTSRMKRSLVQQCQNSDIKKVNRWHSGSHLVMQVFGSLPNILAPPPDAPLAVVAVSSFSELCLETCVNDFGQSPLLAEKPNDNSLVGLHPLTEKLQTDGPRDNNSKHTADVMSLSFSLSGCAIGTVSPV
jgi:hypothetical protein